MQSHPVKLPATDWAAAVARIADEGWFRIAGCLDDAACAELLAAAPGGWRAEGDVGSVRQGGVSSGVALDGAAAAVQALGAAICGGVNAARRALPEVPHFNEVAWSRSDHSAGHHFISAHRDPGPVGGVIAIVTLTGQATFRVRGTSGAAEWVTGDGDLVLLRGNGWPTSDAQCPLHEVAPPETGERAIVTYRHNLNGPGADYFS